MSGYAFSVTTVKHQARSGLLSLVSYPMSGCKNSISRKCHRRFHRSLNSSTEIGTLCSDIKRHIEVDFVNKHDYFVKFVEVFRRFVAVRSLKSKCDVLDAVLCFIKNFEKRNGRLVLKVHTDGVIDIRHALESVSSNGVQVYISVPYTPESHGLSERTYRMIADLSRKCLHETHFPQYWK